jgi:hypothetical protein
MSLAVFNICKVAENGGTVEPVHEQMAGMIRWRCRVLIISMSLLTLFQPPIAVQVQDHAAIGESRSSDSFRILTVIEVNLTVRLFCFNY